MTTISIFLIGGKMCVALRSHRSLKVTYQTLIHCLDMFGAPITAPLNDNYCDCSNCEDEPKASACSNKLVQRRTFLCEDSSTKIYLSRVGDGVWDCPDGSDEAMWSF